ncbi:MAG: hypothetical protein OZ932_08545 [Flavobacteriia bacterium]|nr:hypothetical protein [Flavobacteriia bacterium]
MHTYRSIIALAAGTVFLMAGCSKDPEVLPAPEVGSVALCDAFILPEYMSQDTVMIPTSNGLNTSEACFRYPCMTYSLTLRASRTQYPINGQEITSISVEVDGNSLDSIGLLAQPPMVNTFNPRSFEVGDTLSPYQEVRPAAYLYFADGMEGASSIFPEVWYLGFVKIIDGVKHVGYMRIGTYDPPSGYFFQEVKLAACPGMPIVITE